MELFSSHSQKFAQFSLINRERHKTQALFGNDGSGSRASITTNDDSA